MKTVLVAIAGQTPQIITETLYALQQRGEVPAEVHVLTTTLGKLKVKEKLLNPQDGEFYRFCKDFHIDAESIQFGEDNVHVLGEDRGRPIEDVRTDVDNSVMADHVCAFLKAMAERPGIRIHASLAGSSP